MRARVWCMSLVLVTLGVACGDQPTEVVPDREVRAAAGMAGGPGMTADATSSSEDGLSITTDKDDYAPGDTVWFTGAGWPANDSLDIVLTDDPLTHPPHEWTIRVTAEGTFRDSTYVVDEGDLNVTFTLVATSRGDGRGLFVTFTDGNVTAATAPTTHAPSGAADCVVAAKATFSLGETVCTKTTITVQTPPAGPGDFRIQWVGPAPSTTVVRETNKSGANGTSHVDQFVPAATGTWTIRACKLTGNCETGAFLASSTFTVNAAAAATITSLTSSPNPSNSGQLVTFTASVKSGSPETAVTSGSVSFREGTCSAGTILSGPTALAGNGRASFTKSDLTVGSHTIRACYGGASGFATSDGTVVQVVNAITSTAVTSSQNPSPNGASVTFTATVTSGSPATAVTLGKVSFKTGGTSCANASDLQAGEDLDQNGQVTFATSTLAIGAHVIRACYGGATGFALSEGEVTQQVNNTATVIVLTSSDNPSVTGQSVTFNANVTNNSNPVTTGKLTFKRGGTECSDATVVQNETTPNNLGKVTYTTSFSASESPITIRACYGGSTTPLLSASEAALPQNVDKATTNTTIGSSAATSVLSQPVTFTITVSVVSPGAGAPTGSVTFEQGGTACGNGTNVLATKTLGGGQATFATSSLAVGAHTIRGCYAETTNFKGSNNSTTQTVNKAPTSTAIESDASTSVFSQEVTFKITVSPLSPAVATPTGNVTFEKGGTACGNGTDMLATKALSGGEATFATSSLAVGAHTIRGCYAETANFEGSVNSMTQTVNKAPTSTAIESDASTSVFSQEVTFKITVSPLSPAVATPTGSVTFEQGGTACGNGTSVLATKALSGGEATFATSSLAVGAHAIRGCYAETANFAGSSNSMTQTVNKATTSTEISSSVNPSILNQPVTFSVTVRPVVPAVATPQGNVALHDGTCAAGVVIGVATPLSASGQASFTVSTLAVGMHAVTACYAGNGSFEPSERVVTPSQQVKYNFEGLFAPVDRPTTVNLSKAGQAVPLKWRLTDYNRVPVLNFAPEALGVAVSGIQCTATATLDQIEEYTGSSGLQNLGDGYYQFNWKTPAGYASSCKSIGLNLGEGTPRGPMAYFNFKK
jgi:large repetitive protein